MGGIPNVPPIFPVCPAPCKSFAPIPPTRARRALFPRWGRGRFLVFLCKGLSPPAPPRPNPRGIGIPGGLRYPKTHAGSGTGSRYLPGYRRRRPFRHKKGFCFLPEEGSAGGGGWDKMFMREQGKPPPQGAPRSVAQLPHTPEIFPEFFV